MSVRSTVAAISLALLGATAASAEPQKAAVFDFEYSNVSPQPPTQEELDRIARLSTELRELLKASGRYEIVSVEPARADITKSPDLRKCNGCADDIAKKLGADTAITGEVQKVSNLILNINVYVKDLKSTDQEHAYSVDIRGNNDTSFDRGLKYLVKNRLLEGK